MIKGKMTSGFHVLTDTYGVPYSIRNKCSGKAPGDFPYVDQDTDVFLSRTTNLSKGRDQLIYEYITGLKYDLGIKSLTDSFDFLYLFAQDTQANAVLNLAQNAYDAVPVSSPTFTADAGFTGNGTSSYIDTTFIALSGTTGNWSQNSAAFGCYLRTDLQNNSRVDMGSYSNVSNNGPAYLISRRTDNTPAFGGNSTFASGPAVVTTSRAMFSVTRNRSLAVQFFVNGSFVGVNASTSASTAGKVVLGALWRIDSGAIQAGSYSTRQISMAYGGSSAIDHAIVYKHTQKYMTVIGAAV